MQYSKPDPGSAVSASFKTTSRVIVLCVVALCISGCAGARTPGEQFRKVMADIDKQCRKDKLGPYQEDAPARGIRDTSCDILLLKPYDPLSTPEGRFAHSIKLPPPYDKPKDVYKPGMTSAEYFKALCEAEAGEFVFRTVKGVEGILQMRPYQAETKLLGQFFAYEGIVGQGIGMYSDAQGFFVGDARSHYEYFERAVRGRSGVIFQHWTPVLTKGDQSPSSANNVDLKYVVRDIDTPIAKYGYTQRGLVREKDREYGIKGADLILLDLTSNEPIAFRRVFRRYYFDDGYADPGQVWTDVCPKESDGFEFIKKVLVPPMANKS